MRVVGNFLRSVYAYVAVLLAVVYFTGASQLNRVHSLFHSHNDIVVAHSHEEEEDPCHRLIYHNDNTGGCHHDAHIVTNEKCATCDLVCQTEVAAISNHTFHAGAAACTDFDFSLTSFDDYALIISSSRAPPGIS